MDQFIDKTISGKEPAVKTGNSVPRDAVNLGFFSSSEISPKNNIAVVDLSGLIPENLNDRESSSKLMYANELGILEDEYGNPYISSEDVIVSDIFLSENTYSTTYNIDNVKNSPYAKGYYVSRYFTLLNSMAYIDSNIDYFIDQKFIPSSIKIVDDNGDLYSDPVTGRLKYRISLESFVTEFNYNQNEIPHKIIVYIEDADPVSLRLIYDKVEVDTKGIWSKQILKHSETINALPIFQRVQEESEVIDNSNSSQKIYSLKRATKNSIIKNNRSFQEDNYIFVNKKALSDNRIFEIFNWRIVAKIKSSVDFSTLAGSLDSQSDTIKTNTVNVGVLYSSNFGKDYSQISTFCLANLESSVFNMSNYIFSNPKKAVQDKSSADYWLVDIDNLTEEEIRSYDFLVCDLHWNLTESQSNKINSFVDNAGTILIDTMNAPPNSLLNLNSAFTVSEPDYSITSITPSTFSYNSNSLYLRSIKNNAFDITASEFITNAGIFGYARNPSGSYKRYKYFTNPDLESILSTSSKKIFAALRKTNTTDRLISGNIILSTTGFLKYCNDVYEGSSLIPISNSGPTNISRPISNVISNLIEGPYKILYNCLSVALNDRTESTRIRQDVRSSVHVFIGDWNTNWIINENALFEDEKDKYYKNTIVNSSQKFVREIMQPAKIEYIKEASKLSSVINSIFYDQNQDKIDLYLEFTNENVLWTNTSSVTDDEKSILSSSYNLLKVLNKNITCDVYADKISPKFSIPSSLGPHVVKDKYVASKGENLFGILSLSEVSTPKNYPFNFNLSHSVVSSSDYPKSVDGQIEVTVKAKFTQSNTFSIKTEDARNEETSSTSTTITPGVPCSYPVDQFQSSQSGSYRFNASSQLDVSDIYNAFAYTYDIDEGNTWDEYFAGKGSADYIRYIQATITLAGFSTSIDGIFGADTTKKLKSFQANKNIKQDGIVDSQTKNYLANVWKEASQANIDKYKKNHKTISKYVDAALTSTNVVNGLSSGSGVRLINYSGISDAKRDPDHLQVWVGFRLPSGDGIKNVKSITIGTGDFGTKVSSPSYKGFEVLQVNISDNVDFSTSSRSYAQPYNGKNGTTIIQLGDNPAYKGKYVSVLLRGSSLGGSFGATAEGIYISTIFCTCTNSDTSTSTTTTTTIKHPAKYEDFTKFKEVEADVTLVIPKTKVSFDESVDLINSANLIRYGKITGIYLWALGGEDFTDSKLEYSNLNVPLTSSSYVPSQSRPNEKVDLTNPKANSIQIQSASVINNSVKQSGTNITVPNSLLFISISNNEITSSCNISLYNTAKTYYTSKNITNYWITNPQKSYIREGKNSFNYFDGVVLICDINGNPYGINLSSISTQVNDDIDISYSDITIKNTLPDQGGVHYGFYDNVNKQFLGKSISYTKYQQIGPLNVFIGIYSFDYDGNINTLVDYSGARTGDTFSPVSVPIKMAYPIYNVSMKSQNKIQVLEIPADLDKKEPWPIYVSSGSFTKNVRLSMVRPKGWMAKYNNQTLTAKYDTSNLNGISSSKVFGKGYYDVIDETPIVNNTRSITLRRKGVVTVHESSYDLVRFASSFRQILKVYTREDINSAWEQVPYSYIKDINSKTGIIEFLSPIISSNPMLTKVDYTIKLIGTGVLQSQGVEIPTNPFLNKESVKVNKPLYIYLKPKLVYKDSRTSSDGDYSIQVVEKVLVEEYYEDSVVNFTYNNNIFNSNDISEYDPFALLIGIVYVINTFDDNNFNFKDLRIKGGGITANAFTNDVIDSINESSSYWDVYPALGEAYPKAGYVIIKIPSLVRKNFINPDEVYDIVKRNITAGVVFELQDMEGNDWSGSVTLFT